MRGILWPSGLIAAGLAIGMDARAAEVHILLVGNGQLAAGDQDRLIEQVLESTVPAWTQVEVERLGSDDSTWTRHAQQVEEHSGGWRRALAGHRLWDYAVLQEQVALSGFPLDSPQWRGSRDALLALGKDLRATGATLLLVDGPASRDGDPRFPMRFPDFDTMQGLLDQGMRSYAQALQQQGQPPGVAPLGRAFQLAVQRGVALPSLFASDGERPSGTGAYLSACVIAASLSGWPTSGAATPDGMSPELAANLQRAADEAALGETALSLPQTWARPWTAVAHGGAGRVAAVGARPTAVVSAIEPTLHTLAIGDPDQPRAAGRLAVIEGGAVDVDTLTVAPGGQVLVVGGQLDARRLEAPQHVRGQAALDLQAGATRVDLLVASGAPAYIRLGGVGTLDLRGGQTQDEGAILLIQSGGAATLSGDLAMSIQATAGTLELVPGSVIQGELSKGGSADLVLSAQGDPARVVGTANLKGVLVVRWPEGAADGTSADILKADHLGATSITVDRGHVDVERRGDQDVLVASLGAPPRAARVRESAAPRTGGCGGCAVGGRPSGVILALLALLGLRRRRAGG